MSDKKQFTCWAIRDRIPRVQGIMVLAVLLASAFYIRLQMRIADRDMRNELLARTRLMAQAVNPKRIKALSGSSEDLDNPAYQQIKSQLVLLKKDNPDIGFIYLMGFRADESIFFFADSEPPDSPDASSPGDIFVPQGEFPAAKLRQGIELVAGPGADQWGVWVSAFVPVEDAVTGETVTYLGADIDARFWRRQVLLAGMPGFLLMLTLVAILLVWTWLSRRWRQPGLRPPQWVNRLDLAGVLTIGVILSLYIPWRIYLQETKNRWQFFQQVAGSETAQMVWNLKSIRSPGLEGLAAFFYQGKIIHKNDFFHYAQYLLENPLVYFWLWAPAVPAAEADAFAARVRQEEHPDFTIRSGSAEQPHPGRGRDTLYPVLFAEPAHPHQNVIGFDQGSDSVRQAAISTAIHSRLPAATAPVHLLNDPEAALSIVVYHAVFDPEQEELLKGVVAIGLRLSTIQSRNESKRNLLHIDLAMLQEQGPPVLLSDPQQPKHLQPQNRIQRYLFAFGRVFRLDAEPGENFLQSHPLWWHRIVMLVCVTFTGLAGMIVTLISRRRTELEALVNERTLKLAENEYRFRQLLEHSRSLIWDIDEQGCFTFVNEVSETLLGYQADEMIGKMYFHDLYREDFRQAGKEQLQALFQSQKPMNRLEQQLASKTGDAVWVSSRGMPLFKADGSLGGYRGESTDITEKKIAEEEKERQIGFQKILTQIATKYINLPLEQIDQAINQSLAELGSFLGVDRLYVYEYELDNQFCSNTYEWCAPGISPQISNMQKVPMKEVIWWVKATCMGEVVDIPDVERLPKNDAVYQILQAQGVQSLLCVPMMEEDRCWGFVGVDSVHQKHQYSEGETRLLNVLAQMLVNVRGRIRKETELQQSQQQASAASQAKSDFLTKMSHEIRTPLNGVIGIADLLAETCLDSEQHRLVEIVSSSGKLLLELVNDILDFAKIEAGKLELHNREFDLDELLKGLVGSLAFTAGAKDVELVLAVSPQVPAKVIGDSLRLQQVIMNLAGNAVKFTDQGEVCVSVAMETENSAAITLRFTVRDTGIGIAKDQQPFLFDAFFQADSSNRRKYGGTGLGLPITRGLIEHLGGTLDFSSEIGKGSEFTFTIPLQRVPDYPGFEPLDAAWQNARILIADDNASARQALQQQLEANSLRTVAAQDTASALQLLRQASADNDPFRAALIDATLPGLVAEICQDPGLAGLPVIVLLPVGSKVDGHLADSTRFTRTLTKPFSRPELRAALRGLAKATAPLPVTLAGESVQWAGQGLEVLLAEDNVTNQKIMTLLLDKLGLKADIAGNGLEVLEKMAAKKYALVLMDVQMPDLDGLEATKRIRDPHGLILHHQVPIIAVTAHAIDGYSEVCSRAGMDDYIAKPITLQKLREVLERWLPTAS